MTYAYSPTHITIKASYIRSRATYADRDIDGIHAAIASCCMYTYMCVTNYMV